MKSKNEAIRSAILSCLPAGIGGKTELLDTAVSNGSTVPDPGNIYGVVAEQQLAV
jgi:hypothetical protein